MTVACPPHVQAAMHTNICSSLFVLQYRIDGILFLWTAAEFCWTVAYAQSEIGHPSLWLAIEPACTDALLRSAKTSCLMVSLLQDFAERALDFLLCCYIYSVYSCGCELAVSIESHEQATEAANSKLIEKAGCDRICCCRLCDLGFLISRYARCSVS